ncbi:phage/plasmid replication protein [Paenibacillus sp. FSL W8-0194]|uniref:phage/plasmid replication domain-containing protein n=1 Tax=Paenibacillus sp. FSL W8-0194 TaxID=2921711 RepID=UPI0030DA8BCE
MIDTVKIDIGMQLSQQEIDSVPWTDIKEDPNTNTVFCRLFDTKDKSVPRITYTYKKDSEKGWMKVEVSIPHYMYGSNVYEITPADIKHFYRKLRKHLAYQLRLRLSDIPRIEQCEVEKLHVCHNFKVDNHLEAYLRILSSISLPGYKPTTYCAKGSRQPESVIWKQGKSIIKFYNKFAEVHQKDKSPDHAQHLCDAKGLLRFEVELTDYEMRQKSSHRLVGELLDPAYARKILKQKLSQLGVDQPIKASSMESMLDLINRADMGGKSKNALIGFLTRMKFEGEGACRRAFSKSRSSFHSHYNKLNKLLGTDKIVFSDIDLPPLKLKKRDKKRTALT